VVVEHSKGSKDRDKGLEEEEVVCSRLQELLADHKEEVGDDK